MGIEKDVDGLWVCGNYRTGVAFPDCVTFGYDHAKVVIDHLNDKNKAESRIEDPKVKAEPVVAEVAEEKEEEKIEKPVVAEVAEEKKEEKLEEPVVAEVAEKEKEEKIEEPVLSEVVSKKEKVPK